MSEKRILIASLLKPINDTRMFEKLGLSLSKLKGTEVHICGYAAPIPLTASGIQFHPLFNFSRLSAGRLTAQFKFYRLLKKLRPDLVILGTHELLMAAYLYSRGHKVKLIYDVRENYALNLREQHNYPSIIKNALAQLVTVTEQLTAPAITHFILAERSYADELPFIRNDYTILENKYKKAETYHYPATPVYLSGQPLHLLYSGTIAEEYGIFEAIQLAKGLHQADNKTQLTIIGYCANTATLQKIWQQTRHLPYITLIGGNKLVPHRQILETIPTCNVALLPYRPNKSTYRCVPTKLFEYMAYGLPILISNNPLWHTIVQEHSAGISVDFSKINAPKLLAQLRQTTFYTFGVPQHIFWKQEEHNLLELVKQLSN